MQWWLLGGHFFVGDRNNDDRAVGEITADLAFLRATRPIKPIHGCVI